MSAANSSGREMGPKSETYFDAKALPPQQPQQLSVEGAMPVVNPAKNPANLNNIDKSVKSSGSSGDRGVTPRSGGQYNDIPPSVESLSIQGKPPSGANYGVVPAYNAPFPQQTQQQPAAKSPETKPAASGSAQYSSFVPLQGSSPKVQPSSGATPQGSAAYAPFVPLEGGEAPTKIESKYVGQIPESPRTAPTLVANSSAPKISGLGGLGAHMLGNALAASVADEAESSSKDKKKKDKDKKKK